MIVKRGANSTSGLTPSGSSMYSLSSQSAGCKSENKMFQMKEN